MVATWEDSGVSCPREEKVAGFVSIMLWVGMLRRTFIGFV